MKPALLEILSCPECGGRLDLASYESLPGGDVHSGVLRSDCGSTFLVWRGVPTMRPLAGIPRDFAAAWGTRLQADAPRLAALPPVDPEPDFSFSFEWSAYAYSDLTWEMYLPERVEVFYEYTGLSRVEAPRVRLLDAGCGNGTLTAALAGEGFDVVGLDYSDSVYRALDYARQHLTPELNERLGFVCGDVRQPPFGNEQFDLVYSDGVLHHTPNTKAAFLALAPKTKPGGQFLVWLYRSDGPLRYRIKMKLVRLVQAMTRSWGYHAKWRLCLLGAAVIVPLLRLASLAGSRRRRAIPIRLKALNLFDTISPDYDFEHTPEEVAQWYAEAGFSDVKDVSVAKFRLNEGGFAMIGRRK